MREGDKISIQNQAFDYLEGLVDDGPPDPPDVYARQTEDARHVFRAKPENDHREKAYDCFGRWYWKDGSIY